MVPQTVRRVFAVVSIAALFATGCSDTAAPGDANRPAPQPSVVVTQLQDVAPTTQSPPPTSISPTEQPAEASGRLEDFATIEVVAINGGAIATLSGNPDQALGGDFPDHAVGSNAPRAVVKVTHPGDPARLNPAERDFSFGADVVLDQINATTDSGDNGNNLVQRGLFADLSQFKLQIDDSRPSCRLKGSAGEAFIRGTVIVPGEPYRVRCSRVANEVRLQVWPINTDGSLGAAITDKFRPAPVGAITFPDHTALSIGGKITDAGGIDPASDQFNGTIVNVFLDMGSTETGEAA